MTINDETIAAMIQARDKIREEDRRITQEIKAAKKAMSEAKKKTPTTNVSFESYEKLRTENVRLRALIAVFKKSDNLTYEQVGEFLGVSSGRAKVLVDRGRYELYNVTSEEDITG